MSAPELGFYALAGHVESPRDMLAELRLAEKLGLGAAFLSERLNVKEAASLSGAAVAVTEHLRVVTAATPAQLAPVVTASCAKGDHKGLSGEHATWPRRWQTGSRRLTRRRSR